MKHSLSMIKKLEMLKTFLNNKKKIITKSKSKSR